MNRRTHDPSHPVEPMGERLTQLLEMLSGLDWRIRPETLYTPLGAFALTYGVDAAGPYVVLAPEAAGGFLVEVEAGPCALPTGVRVYYGGR